MIESYRQSGISVDTNRGLLNQTNAKVANHEAAYKFANHKKGERFVAGLNALLVEVNGMKGSAKKRV